MRPPLVLLRHARTSWNAQGRLNSHTDTGLDDAGAAQATEVAEGLHGLDGLRLVRSPARRAAQTAAPLESLTSHPPAIDDRLVEVDFGRFEGRTMTECGRDPAFLAWRTGEPTDGDLAEPLIEAAARAQTCVDEHWRGSDQTLVVVSHGVLLRALLCVYVLGMPVASYRRLRLDNARAVVLTDDGTTRRVAGLNLAARDVPTLVEA